MAEVPRNQLPSGYDEDFVNAVEEEILCLICHLPLKEPIQTRCGHRFCKECLEEHFRRQGIQKKATSCPADREGLDRDKDVFPDKATERKILSFAIKCPNEGCDWTGELRTKEVHLASCLFKIVSCTNQNCHVTVQRKELEEHVTITCRWKIIKCDHCTKPHPKCKIKDHIAQCSKFPVTCPNSCGVSIPREMIPNHIKDDCPLEVIPCPYAKMGCTTEIQRNQVESHLQSAVRLHLDLACVKLQKTEVKLNDTENKLNETQEKLKTVSNQVEKLDKPFIWKINDFSELLRQAKAEETKFFTSVPFYMCSASTESYGYKLKVRVDPNGYGDGENTHLSVFIIVMKGEYDAILSWPFKKNVKFTLIDQQEDSYERENVNMEFKPGNNPENFARPTLEENLGMGFLQFISQEKLHSRRYIVDDTMFVQVEIGP